MEKGTKCLVIYKDDTQVRSKTLIYLGNDSGLISFDNKTNGKKEAIPVYNIIRMEEIKEDGPTKNT